MPRLPVRLHLKHGGYYYVYRNKWTLLSRDYGDALRQYAALMSGQGTGMPALLDRYLLRQKEVVRATTLKNYERLTVRLKNIFSDFAPNQVMPKHIYAVRNQYRAKPSLANHLVSHLKGTFQLAIEEGLVVTNPAREVSFLKEPKRDRYITDAEFKAIRDMANPSLRSIMDVAYLTGQRIGDILAIKRQDLRDKGIFVRQTKTETELIVGWTPELRAAVEDAKRIHQSVKGMHLFHKRDGSPYAYRTVHDFWNRARIKAGLKDCRIHDIRAKAGTDARKQGQDSKALLGHKSDSAHARYIREKEVPVVEAVRKS